MSIFTEFPHLLLDIFHVVWLGKLFRKKNGNSNSSFLTKIFNHTIIKIYMVLCIIMQHINIKKVKDDDGDSSHLEEVPVSPGECEPDTEYTISIVYCC